VSKTTFDANWLSKLTFVAFYAEISEWDNCCSIYLTAKAKQGEKSVSYASKLRRESGGSMQDGRLSHNSIWS